MKKIDEQNETLFKVGAVYAVHRSNHNMKYVQTSNNLA